MTFYRLEKLINLYDGYRQAFRVGGQPLLLLQEGGQCWLIRDLCPHKAFPLRNGTLRGTVLRCNHHGLDFDLSKGGRCIQQPRHFCLTTYPLQYDGDSIGVELD
jgi:nitrite reductase/ring-hydroxylating ferredoxin subunit